MTDVLFSEPLATDMEVLRAEARAKRQIMFDCRNALVRDERLVTCRWHVAPATLRAVLRGRSSGMCARCAFYECTGEGE